jgi:hypothetical protein
VVAAILLRNKGADSFKGMTGNWCIKLSSFNGQVSMSRNFLPLLNSMMHTTPGRVKTQSTSEDRTQARLTGDRKHSEIRKKKFMGVCDYCGDKAGWLQNSHPACVAKASTTSQTVKDLVFSGTVAGKSYEELSAEVQKDVGRSKGPIQVCS